MQQPCHGWPSQLTLSQPLPSQLGYLLVTNLTARNKLGLIKNKSPGGGTTFAHSHSQLFWMALPETPHALKHSPVLGGNPQLQALRVRGLLEGQKGKAEEIGKFCVPSARGEIAPQHAECSHFPHSPPSPQRAFQRGRKQCSSP